MIVKYNLKYRIILILFLLSYNNVKSQDFNYEGAIPTWNQTGKIKNKLNYNIFVSTILNLLPKTINETKYPSSDLQLYIQPSLVYVFNKNFNISNSYTFQRNNPFDNKYINEHRLWQQATINHNIANGIMMHRFRFEERWIQNKVKNYYPFSTRARYLIGFNIPLQGKSL